MADCQLDKPRFVSSISGAASPIGHYSQAVELPTGLVLFSGIKAWNPQSGQLTGETITAQTDLIFANLRTSLKHFGLGLEHLVRIQCHLAKGSDYEEFNRAYANCLGTAKPVRTTLAGYELRGGALVELVADAYRF